MPFPVALFTRAWIEISGVACTAGAFPVALFTRAWIEIKRGKPFRIGISGRPLHEGVD